MKSEEKQLDLLLQNIGGRSTLYEREEPKTAKIKEKPTIKQKETAKKMKPRPQKTPMQKKMPKVRVPIMALKPQKMIDSPNAFVETWTQLPQKAPLIFAKVKTNIVQSALTVRKRLPGYVYPSRQDMLSDHKKQKQNMASRK